MTLPRGEDERPAMRREFAQLREWVEARAQAQEALVRAMLAQAPALAAEALEGRIQLAALEAIAFAEQGLDRHDAALAALGRRVAELAKEPAPSAPERAPVEARDFLIGPAAPEWEYCARLPLREDSEAAFLADAGALPILPGGAARLVAMEIVERVPAPRLPALLAHWLSRLAPDGELVVATLDGPTLAADYAALRARLAEPRPLRHLFDAESLADALRAAGLAPQPPRRARFALEIVARRALP